MLKQENEFLNKGKIIFSLTLHLLFAIHNSHIVTRYHTVLQVFAKFLATIRYYHLKPSWGRTLLNNFHVKIKMDLVFASTNQIKKLGFQQFML
jgi:hypothetical protein